MQDRRQQHEAPAPAGSPRSNPARHVLEVHAVDGADQPGWQQHHRRDRKDLDDVVLVERDHAEQGIEKELILLVR